MKDIKRNILLNPGPATTSQSVKDALVVPDICPREREFGDLLQSIANDLVKVVKGEKEYNAVLFAGSGTAAVEAMLTSIVPKDKKVLIVENGAYGTRMLKIAQTFHMQVVRYQLPYGEYPDLTIMEELLANNKNISYIAVVHHETTTGMLNPIDEINELAKKYGVGVLVDAMSSYAGVPIDLNTLNVDALVSSANKCIQGMPGISFVIIKNSLLNKLTLNNRSFYLDIKAQHEYFQKTKQMQFTPPVQIAYALKQALKDCFEETIEKRYKRYNDNWVLLYNGIKSLGFRLLLPVEQESKILCAICEPKDSNYNFNEMHDYLYNKGFTIYPGKGARENTFRLAIVGDLYKVDIENFLSELKNYIEEKNIKDF